MTKSRISFVPEQQDRDAIKLIREQNGMMHDASAIRYALRKIAKIIKKREARSKNGS